MNLDLVRRIVSEETWTLQHFACGHAKPGAWRAQEDDTDAGFAAASARPEGF